MTIAIIRPNNITTPIMKTWFLGGILIGLVMANTGNKFVHIKEKNKTGLQKESTHMDASFVPDKPKMKLLY